MWILRTNTQDPDVTFRIQKGTIKTLGRATRADLILDAALVSRLHCRFTTGGDGRLVVEDLKSTNGTFVNGKRIRRAPLDPGDLLRVGRVELTIEADA